MTTPSKIPAPQAAFVDPNTGYLTRVGNNYLNSLTQNVNTAAAGSVETAVGSGLEGGGIVADGLSLSIAPNGVSNAMIRQSAGYSVIGRAFGTAGNVADITATADNRVLARIGGVLAFWDAALVPGALADGNYGDVTVSGSGTVITINPAVVTIAKMADIGVSGHKIAVLDGAATTWSAGSTWTGTVAASKFSVGTEAEQGFNPAFVAKRNVSDFTAGSAHGFSDSTVISGYTGGSNAYNSFEARCQLSGVGNLQHWAAFQFNGLIGQTGTTTDLWGLFTAPIVNTGAVTNFYGVEIMPLRGTGTVGTAYGVLIRDIGANGLGTTRYAIKTEGTSDLIAFAGRLDSTNYISTSGNTTPPLSGKRLVFNFNPAFNAGAGAGNLICGDFGIGYCEQFYDALKHNFRISGVDAASFTSGGLTLVSPLAPAYGGTGIPSYVVGDIIYATGATALATLTDVATGNALISGGVATAPAWGKIGISTHVSGLGTGVATALGINVGSAGAFVTFNGALGTPSSGTLTNCTGLPNTGVTGLGTMSTQNANAVAIAGGFATFDGAINGTGTTSGAASNIIFRGTSGGAAATTGLRLLDTDDSHTLRVVCDSNLTANRTFFIEPGDANRTLDISATDVTITASGAALTALTIAQGNLIYGTGAATVAVLAKDTNATRYLSNTGTSNNPAWAQVNAANGVTGTLPVTNGGIGVATITGLLQGNGTSAVTAITDSSTTGQVLRVTGASTYAWGALSLSTAAAITGTLPAGNGGTGVTTLGNITKTDDTNVTMTLGGTPTGAVITSTSFTLGWTGTLAVARGGTGGGSASGTLLDNITGFSSTGIMARTASGTYSFRTITGTSSEITLSNGDGVSGNPTISLATSITGAWTAWTPTLTSSAGTITSYTTGTCAYKQIGKSVWYYGLVTITNAGTGSGSAIVTLPVSTAIARLPGYGEENALTGFMLRSLTTAGSANLTLRDYSNGAVVATNAAIYFAGFYEVS